MCVRGGGSCFLVDHLGCTLGVAVESKLCLWRRIAACGGCGLLEERLIGRRFAGRTFLRCQWTLFGGAFDCLADDAAGVFEIFRAC